MDENKLPLPGTEFAADSSTSAPKDAVEKKAAGAPDSSTTLSQAATESAEQSSGKKPTFAPPQEGKMDYSNVANPPAESSSLTPQQAIPSFRPGNIFDLVNQANQSQSQLQQAPEAMQPFPVGQEAQTENVIPRAQVEGPSGNWNSPNFLNPLAALAESKVAAGNNDEKLGFQKLYDAQAAVDLLTPENVRIILNDLEKIKQDLPKEMDSMKRAQMQERVNLGTQILDSRWETPLRLALLSLKIGSQFGQPPAEAFRLLQQATMIRPELKDDPDVQKAIENVSTNYGPMAQAVKQSLQQAIGYGVQAAGQRPQERSAFQTDRELAQRLASQGEKALQASADPSVHAREASVLMRTKGVLSDEAKKEHSKAIELAKDVIHSDGKSYNLVLADVTQTKKDIAGKQVSLANKQTELDEAKKKSKELAAKCFALQKVRDEELAKAGGKNYLEAGWTMLTRTVKNCNGETAKEDKAMADAMAEMTAQGKKVAKLEAERKTIVAEIKTTEGSLKDKQIRLAEIGKPVTEKHIAYAKILMQDADLRSLEMEKASKAGNADESNKHQAAVLENILAASKQLSRAEKISPDLAKDGELKSLKDKYSMITSSVSDKMTSLPPAVAQDVDDRFLNVVNHYNLIRSPEMLQLAKARVMSQEQGDFIKELQVLQAKHPELKENPKLIAAMRLIGKGEQVTEESLAQQATMESKTFSIGSSLQKGSESLSKFEVLMANKQYKDAEEALKEGIKGFKPILEEGHRKLQETEEAIKSCSSLEELAALNAQKQTQEQGIAQVEAALLTDIGRLYLTPEKRQEKDQVIEGPGYKPEQAIQALNLAKASIPGIDKNTMFQDQLKLAQDLQKGIKDMELQAREQAEEGKVAGIDLATTLAAWGGAAGGAALATAGLVGAGVMVVGAPVTVPVGLAILGASVVGGAVIGGLTKWGAANLVDAKDKDAVSNLSKGAFIGGTTGIGGGGLKVGGMVLAEGLAVGGNTIYRGIKIADVANKVSKTAPLTERAIRATSTATRLESAAGNAAQEVQLGQQILLEKFNEGKITQSAYLAASQSLSTGSLAAGETAGVLQWVGIPMKEEFFQLTAAGMKLKAAAGAGGTKAVDYGYEALKLGLPKATMNPCHKLNVFGHTMNGAKIAGNWVSNQGKLAAYATPYVATRAGVAGLAIASGSSAYHGGIYGSKVAGGEINEATGETWNAGDAISMTALNTARDTSIGLAGMGLLYGVSRAPLQTVDAMTTGGLGGMALGLAGKVGNGALNKMGAKVGNIGPVAAAKTFFTDTLRHDNRGVIAPFARNVLPLSSSSGFGYAMAADSSSVTNNRLAKLNRDLENQEIQVAEAEAGSTASQQSEAPPQPKATAKVVETETQVAPPSNETASAETNAPNTASTDDQPQPITDS